MSLINLYIKLIIYKLNTFVLFFLFFHFGVKKIFFSQEVNKKDMCMFN